MSTDEQTTTEPTAVQVRVVGGGTPTAAELAALVVALTPVGAPAGEPGQPGRAGVAGAWARAALLEGVGARPIVSAPELDRADHAHPARPRG